MTSTAVEKTLPPAPARVSLFDRLRFGLGRDRLRDFTDLAAKNGDVSSFRARGREFRFFVHPDAVRDVLVTHDERFAKGPALRRVKATLGEGLLTSEGDLHRRQRRLVQPSLHPHQVARLAEVMTRLTVETVESWRDGQVIDLHEQMMQLTLRIVAAALFGADVAADVREIARAMDISVGMFVRAMSPWGPLLNHLPLPSNFRFRSAWGRLMRIIDRFIAERRARPEETRDDLLSRLLRAADPEGGATMTDRQLRDEAITLFTAGHETTAGALTFALYLLSQNPESFERLAEETDRELGGRPPIARDTDRLEWTRMVLSESMRLYPPAWALGRLSLEPCEIAGTKIDAGTVVLLSQWVTHRDPRWWPDPLRFDPSRFDPEARAGRPRWAWFPFGGGSRGCIGESFAWMEATLVLAIVAHRRKLEYVGDAPPGLRPLITLRPAGPVRMRVRSR